MNPGIESAATDGSGTATPPVKTTSGNLKKLLVGVLIMGALSTFMANAGTFANFTAEVDNPGSVKTGTLVIERPTQGGVTDCFSTDPAAVSKTVTAANLAACGALFASTLSSAGGTATQNLTIINQGSITPSAGNFKLACANNSNPFNGFSGTADLCTIMSVVVAETTTAGGTTLVASGAQLFGTCATTATASCTAAAGPASGATGTTVPLTAGQRVGTHFYLVQVAMATAPDNTYQGRTAGLTFNWTLTE